MGVVKHLNSSLNAIDLNQKTIKYDLKTMCLTINKQSPDFYFVIILSNYLILNYSRENDRGNNRPM